MKVRELIEELEKMNEPESEVRIEREWEIERVTFGGGHTVSVELDGFGNYVDSLEERIHDLEKELDELESQDSDRDDWM